MSRKRMLIHQFSRLTSSLLVCPVAVLALVSNTHAREIGIAFIEDGLGEQSPAISSLVIQELKPLLNNGDQLRPLEFAPNGTSTNIKDSLALAQANKQVDFIVATGVIGSQEIYRQRRFPKPTYLLRVIDPDLTGAPVRDNVRNLRSYSIVNGIVDVFARLSDLFQAKRVGILLPEGSVIAQRSLGGAVAAAAGKAGVEARFVGVDFTRELPPQLADIDAIILPPISLSEEQSSKLLQTLIDQKIPSFAVGGNRLVRSGALISDTLEEDDRVLARRVALDLQLAIYGEVRTQGMRLLNARKSTTINIDTARALAIDIALDEILTARVVQGDSSATSLEFVASLKLADTKNPALRGQFQQLRVDEESLAQARAARRPQLSAQLEYTRRGEELPEQDTLAAVALSQTLFSPSANANVDVAKLGLDASRMSLQQAKLDTVQQTSRAYFQALQTQAQFQSSLRDLALNRENLSLAEQRKRSGSGSGAEIYRWQAVIAASETAVLRAYTANTSAQTQLAQLLNTRLPIPTTLADVGLDQPPFDILHKGIEPFLISTGQSELLREASAARALAQSPQLESASANVAINDTLLKATRQSYYVPEFSLSASYGHFIDSTATAAGVELDDEHDWNFALTAKLPIWTAGTRRSLIRQYAAQSELADTRLQSTRIALWASSNDAVNNLVANYRAIGLSDLAEEAARKSQQITQNAYKLGAASVTELLDTQNEYREAQDNTHIARYQYLAALVDFQALMGEMPMLKPGTEQQRWMQEFRQSMLSEASQ